MLTRFCLIAAGVLVMLSVLPPLPVQAIPAGTEVAWAQVRLSGQLPSGRPRPLVGWDDVNEIVYMYSGYTSHGDLWEYDLERHVWSQPSPSTTAPPSTFGTNLSQISGAWDPVHQQLLAWGTDSATGENQLWRYTPGTHAWKRLAPGGTPPGGVRTAAWDTASARLLIYSGSGTENDVVAYVPSPTNDGTWVSITATGEVPAGRYYPGFVWDSSRQRLLMFGGAPANCCNSLWYNDLWSFSPSTATWARLTPSDGVVPSPRLAPAYAWDGIRGELLLFGGTNGSQSVFLDDAWAYNSAQNKWTLLRPGRVYPGRRDSGSLIFDKTRDQMVLFGGSDGDWLNDLWRATRDPAVVTGAGDWYDGQGVNVCYPAGGRSSDYCGGEHYVVGDPRDGAGNALGWWQCVELAQRFYQSQGWTSGLFDGVLGAADIRTWATSLETSTSHVRWHDQGSGYIPRAGDLIVTDRSAGNYGAGHVSIVNWTDTSSHTVHVVEQNYSPTGRASYAYDSAGNLTRKGATDYTDTTLIPGYTDTTPILGTVQVVQSTATATPTDGGAVHLPSGIELAVNPGGPAASAMLSLRAFDATTLPVPLPAGLELYGYGALVTLPDLNSGASATLSFPYDPSSLPTGWTFGVYQDGDWTALPTTFTETTATAHVTTSTGFALLMAPGSLAAPGAPTAVTAIRGNAQATVSWTAPLANGSPITKYTVTSSLGAKTCTWSSGPFSCTVGGLTNGTPYTFTVTATNAVGTSPASVPSVVVTPATVPAKPNPPTALRGNASAIVSWTAPAANGSPITAYTVTSSPDAKTCTWSSGPLSCTVSGLTNGTPYTFTVRATNGVGRGPASNPSNSVTPATVPGATGGVKAVSRNTKAIVSWTAPSSTGGSPITLYTVTSSPGGKTCTTSGALSCTVSGLTNSTWYTFTVRATNALGAGAPSVASVAVLPLPSIVRDGGADVFATAVAVSQASFPANCGCVAYIANAYNWPDALAGAAAAGTVRGPVLFAAASGTLNSSTAAELTRLKPTRIIVLGGTGVISASVYSALGVYAPAITRYFGADRYATAVDVSSHTFKASCGCTAYIANALNYPDALAGAAAAGRAAGPVLLVSASGAINGATANELTRLKPARIVVLGGTGVVSTGVYNLLAKYAPAITRDFGSDRYATAANVSAKTFPAACGCIAYVAAGTDSQSAIAGAGAAGSLQGPLLLVATNGALPSATATELARLKPYRIVVLGSTSQVSASVYALLAPYATGG